MYSAILIIRQFITSVEASTNFSKKKKSLVETCILLAKISFLFFIETSSDHKIWKFSSIS